MLNKNYLKKLKSINSYVMPVCNYLSFFGFFFVKNQTEAICVMLLMAPTILNWIIGEPIKIKADIKKFEFFHSKLINNSNELDNKKILKEISKEK